MTLTAQRLPAPRTTTAPARVAASTTPLLTVDLATVASSYGALQAALPGVQLHYAVKANPSPMVLRTLAGAGARWDVASPGEIDLVLEVDPDPSHLSYGNTVKKAADIAYAFARWSHGRWTGRPWNPSERSMNVSAVVLVVAIVVFTVLRNTPAGSWLAP